MQALRVLRLQCSAVQCSAVQCSAVCGCAWGAPFCEPGVPLAIRAELPACPFALLCSQLWVHILMMAFVMVILSALILTPRTRLPACLPACLFICLLACLLAAALASIITFQSHCHPCLPHCHL